MIEKASFFALVQEASRNRESYVQQAKSKVVRWEYTEGDRYAIPPFWFERNLEPQAPLLDSEDGTVAYGFDVDGHVCYVQWIIEECFDRENDRLINRRYQNGSLDSIEVVQIADDKPVHYTEFIVRNGTEPGQEWHFEEKYQYDHDRLTTILRREYWNAGQDERRQEFTLTYDGEGALFSIYKDGSHHYQVFQEEQVRELREKVKKELIIASEQAMKRIGLKIGDETLCFVAIYLHDEPEAVIAPVFQPGVQRIRDEQLLEGEGPAGLWNSGEHPVSYQDDPEDDKLKEPFHLLLAYWQVYSDWSNSLLRPVLPYGTWWGEAKALWQEVAMELNRMDWKPYIRVTDLFVVFADEEGFDVDGGDFEGSVPLEKILLLREAGLL
ncbi:hypothetical protein [Gorillibacterium sp. CAU 1737]|uniref:hypothetical protein n=1 Tax=Gorillibacterium sp. CAU 1737 TaxID=3140362 RepID=UPI003260C55E